MRVIAPAERLAERSMSFLVGVADLRESKITSAVVTLLLRRTGGVRDILAVVVTRGER